VDFVEICNIYVGKMIIKAAERIFNSDKICRSYSDLNFGVTFLEHSVVLLLAYIFLDMSACLPKSPTVFCYTLWCCEAAAYCSCGRLFEGYLSRTDAPSKADFHDKVGQAMEKMSRCIKTRSVRSCLYDGAFNRALPVIYTRKILFISASIIAVIVYS